MRHDALILDLGNVLVLHDNERLFGALAQALERTPEALRTALAGSGLFEAANRGHLPGDALRRALLAKVGGALSSSRWVELWSSHFTVHAPMVARVERLVEELPLVLLSNTHDQHLEWILPRVPVLRRFRGLVLSCQEGLVKPEPAIYRRALEVAGTAPARTAFFDDVPAYVEAARAVGLEGHVFTTPEAFDAALR